MDGDGLLPPDDEVEENDAPGEGGEVLQFPGLSDTGEIEFDADAYSTEELAALSSLSDDPDAPADPEPDDDSEIEDFTEEHYVQSTTREYQGLADSIAEAAALEHEQSAVAAAMPGMDQGVIGFEDMTGEDDADPEQIHEIDRARRSDLALRVVDWT